MPLAEHAAVHAVESEKAALVALEQGWRHAKGLRKVTIEARDLFRRPMMPEELTCYDGAGIDPPRAGAEAQAEQLSRSDIAKIAMVSCNPVTFARDAKILVGAGYRLSDVHVVDQFRWSPHVELAALLQRGD